MVGDLIMLPVRVGVRATQLWLRAAEGSVSIAVNATSRLVGLAAARASGGDGDGGTATMPRSDTESWQQPEPAPTETTPAAPRPREAPRSRAPEREDRSARANATDAATDPAIAPQPSTPPREPEPVHVSEEPTLVEELAEPGAEDGAGAEIHIEEPWEGYAQMKAKEILSRLAGATPAELAAVQLYENSQRQRQTILNAVQRELRRTNGRSG